MNIFEREITPEELKELINEAYSTEHVIKKRLPMNLYSMAKEQYELKAKKDAIVSKMYEKTRRKVKDVILIDDDSAIIKVLDKFGEETEKEWFYIYNNGRIESSITPNFYHALIMLVCWKTDNGIGDASMLIAMLIAKMLGINI